MRSLALSKNGQVMLTGSYDGIVRLWDVQSGREIRKFEGHSSIVFDVEISPNGRYVLTGSRDNTARLWEIETGREVRKYIGHTSGVQSVAFSPDGHKVLTGSLDGTARLWSVSSERQIRQFNCNFLGLLGVHSVEFLPAGLQMITGGMDSVCLWDVQSGRQIRKFKSDNEKIHCLSCSSDGRFVLTGNSDDTARLWEASSGREIHQFGGHSSAVTSAAFSSDGARVLTCDLFGQIRLWDRISCREINSYKGHSSQVYSSAFMPDNKHVLTCSQDKTAILWDAVSGHEIVKFEGYNSNIHSVAFSTDDRLMATGCFDGTVQLWDASSGQGKIKLQNGNGPIQVIRFSDNRRQVFIGSLNGPSRLWSVDSARIANTIQQKKSGVKIEISPDFNQVLQWNHRESDVYWRNSSGKVLSKISYDSSRITSVALSPSGHYVFSGDDKGIIHLRDIDSGQKIYQFDRFNSGVRIVQYSQDGNYISVITYAGIMYILEAMSGREIQKFQEHDSEVASLGFSPDGLHLLIGNNLGTAYLYEVESGKVIKKFDGHTDRITSIAFSQYGSFVLTGSWDNSARLWDIESGQELCQLYSMKDGWAVIRRDGRFAAKVSKPVEGLSWVVPDDPFRPLPPEIFMRDYYEPRLLPRLLAGEEFPAVRPLQDLNRVQPIVEISEITAVEGAENRVNVTVRVSGNQGEFGIDEHKRLMKTGVYDLRLFRDGQLVGQSPSNAEAAALPTIASDADRLKWRQATQVCGADKSTTKTFTVQLPRNRAGEEIEFTAYAFNEDRVKSETAQVTHQIPEDLTPVTPRAYLLTVGVSAYESSDWDLEFAAHDARRLQEVLGEHLSGYEVIPIPLISEYNDNKKILVNTATKANIHHALQVLAGESVAAADREALPQELRAATPDDLVLISFSGHGYTHQDGTFYFFPHDIGANRSRGKLPDALLERSLSSTELSFWLRNLDADELVMIIDACQSTGAVDRKDVKLGPFGSRGLGQLAYDKGMRVLAASQTEEVALESSKIKQGLLTYALVTDGLEKQRAAQEGEITLSGWLNYASQRVPTLFEEVSAGEVKNAEGSAAKDVLIEWDLDSEEPLPIQQPSLFEFRTNGRAIRLQKQNTTKQIAP